MAAMIDREWLSTLRGAYTIEQLYGMAADAGLLDRAGGREVIHHRDTRGRRRLRGALQTLKRQGGARPGGDSVWILDGTPERPRTVLLVSLIGAPSSCRNRSPVLEVGGFGHTPGPRRAIATFARPSRSTVSSARPGGPGHPDWLQGYAPMSADQ